MMKNILLIVLFVLNFPVLSMNTSGEGETSHLCNKENSGEIDVVIDIHNDELEGEVVSQDALKDALKVKDCFFQSVEKKDYARASFYFQNKIGDINLKNSENQTPLMLAVKNLYNLLVELFLSNKANVKSIDSKGNNALHYIIDFWENWEKNKPVNGYGNRNVAWHIYLTREIIKNLLNYGLDIDSRDNEGNTILIKAINNNLPIEVLSLIGEFRNLKVSEATENKEKSKSVSHMPPESIFEETCPFCIIL